MVTLKKDMIHVYDRFEQETGERILNGSLKAGDSVSFGGLLGQAPIMPIKTSSPAKFIARGGLIPAPLHSLKN